MKRDHENAVHETQTLAAASAAAHPPAHGIPAPLIAPLCMPTEPAAEVAAAPRRAGNPHALWFWGV